MYAKSDNIKRPLPQQCVDDVACHHQQTMSVTETKRLKSKFEIQHFNNNNSKYTDLI